MTVLILGGTAEALDLAGLLTSVRPRLRVVTSLAGRTVLTRALPGEVRVGGFGGARGLADWIEAHAVRAVIDATHPFARTMADNARRASALTGVPLVKLDRASWTAEPGDRWTVVADGGQAAVRLRDMGARPFLTVGRQGLEPFLADPVPWALVRLLETAPPPVPGWEVTVGRGPFGVAEETALMARHGIDVLVTKASGGGATGAKLVAARRLGLPVLMIARPPDPAQARVPDAAAALAWLDEVVPG